MKTTVFLLTSVLFQCYGGISDTNTLAPLPIKLPMPALAQGPANDLKGNKIEPIPSKPPRHYGPLGVTNLALRKAVTSSCGKLISGTLSQITDGQKEAYPEQIVEMRSGVQWVQVDLERNCTICAIAIWHDFQFPRAIYQAVIVQTADDSDFTKNVYTLFNNDDKDEVGLGVGKDKKYLETNYGKVIDASDVRARYIRVYSSGNNIDPYNKWEKPGTDSHPNSINCYMEIEV